MKKLIIGADPFPPYQYLDSFGNIQGLDYETVIHAFSCVGYNDIEVRLDEWSKIATAIKEKRLDAVFQVQKTPQREQMYFFSNIFRFAETEGISRNCELENLTWYDVKNLKLSIGTIKNYAYGELIDALFSNDQCAFETQEKLLNAVSTGGVDIGIIDRGVKNYLQEKNGINPPHIIESLTFQRPLHVMFNDEFLCHEFNQGLLTIQQQ